MLKAMNVSADLDIKYDENSNLDINLDGEDMGALIGKEDKL